MLIVTRLRQAPRAALWPGLAGLLPFIGCAAALLLADDAWREPMRRALVAYGALILAFVGAIHWGIAMMAGRWPRPADGRPDAQAAAGPGVPTPIAAFGFVWSVVPALWGWLALAVGFLPALGLLGIGFAVQLAVDFRVAAALSLPAWYLALRSVLTSAVLLCLLLALLATALSA